MFSSCNCKNKEIEIPVYDENTTNLVLHYFPIAGRGELIKLIALVGGLHLNVKQYPLDFSNPNASYKKIATQLGFEGFGLPLLEDGEFVINQSGAIQDYLANISPHFPQLTPKEKAIDDIFSFTLEEAISGAAKVVFKVEKPETLKPLLIRLLTLLDNYIPETGFVLAKTQPTKADLSLFIIFEAYLPFLAAKEMLVNGDDLDLNTLYPKITNLVNKVSLFKPIATYLKSQNCSLKKGLSNTTNA